MRKIYYVGKTLKIFKIGIRIWAEILKSVSSNFDDCCIEVGNTILQWIFLAFH